MVPSLPLLSCESSVSVKENPDRKKKMKLCRSSKLNFSSSCFIVDGSHVKVLWLHVVVFSEHDVLHFWDNAHLFKYYPVKVAQNCVNSFSYSNQTCVQVFKFLFALDK